MTSLPAGASLADFIHDRQASGRRVVTVSRSEMITHKGCQRRHYYEKVYGGRGIVKIKLDAPLATGGYVHVGLAELLKGHSATDAAWMATQLYMAECEARGMQVEKTEDMGQVVREQIGLTEAIIHLCARRTLPRLLEDYEVVDVEREEWFVLYEDSKLTIIMEARCDGLLRTRQTRKIGGAYSEKSFPVAAELTTGDLYVLSWKTASRWDSRAAKEAKVDMQGLSEAYAVELRVGEPVMGAQMCYFIKGQRKEYPQDSGQYIQSSPFVHAWMNGSGPTPQFAWTYTWDDPELVNDWGKPVGHRLGKGWRHCFIPDHMPVPEWIQMLDEGHVQPEAGDCLESQFVMPMPEARTPAQRFHWLRQAEAHALEIAASSAAIAGAQDQEDLEYLLDVVARQTERACNYPRACTFWELCWGGEDVENPITLYQIRDPNHPGDALIYGVEE